MDLLIRWPGNFGVAILGAILARLLVPASAVGVALAAEARGIGLLHLLDAPAAIAGPLAFIALDCAIYWQHRLFHAIPVLWRVHRMHHTDLEIDASTGLRFHPLEIVLSLLIKLMVVVALGAPALAVLAFEVVLNASSVFNHANLRLPAWLDSGLRRFVVTPDMHRVHHSVRREETNSNFGFFLSFWDRWFGSYTAQPADGHTAMSIGLPEYRELNAVRVDSMLADPFRTPAAAK